jgi:DNA-binding FadR family transcriptional regulator
VPARKRSETRSREKPQLIADELRALIVSGELSEGDSLGHEPDLVERFGVSRPSLREALRILEAEGLITVVRGVRGGVVVHEPDERMTARTAALLLQARNVPLADVFEARSLLEPIAAKAIATMRGRRAAIEHLRSLIHEEEAAIGDPERFGIANAAFHQQLVSLAGNQTLSIVAEMLNEIVVRAVTAVSRGTTASDRSRSVDEASVRRSDCSNFSRPVTAPRRRHTGDRTCRSSGASCSDRKPRRSSTSCTTTDVVHH